MPDIPAPSGPGRCVAERRPQAGAPRLDTPRFPDPGTPFDGLRAFGFGRDPGPYFPRDRTRGKSIRTNIE